MELPGELRNRIIEYALYHEDEGVIAPLPDGTYDNATVLVAGERHVYRSGSLMELGSCFTKLAGALCNPSEEYGERQNILGHRISALIALDGQIGAAVAKQPGNQLHVCQLDRLVQPTLT